MTGIELASLLKEYGGWGLSAILMLVIAVQYRDNQRLSTGHIERLITGLNAASNAATGVQGAMTELQRLIDSSGKAVGEHGHQIAILVGKVEHGFGNMSAGMQAVVRELEKLRERNERADRDRGERDRS